MAATFGARLRAYRQALGLTLQQMGTHLDVSESLLAKIETGRRNPPLKAEFYDRLSTVPGLDGAAIAELLALAPRVLRIPDAAIRPLELPLSEDYTIRLRIRPGAEHQAPALLTTLGQLLEGLAPVESAQVIFPRTAQGRLYWPHELREEDEPRQEDPTNTGGPTDPAKAHEPRPAASPRRRR